jgi:hypothetical protein
MTIPTDDQRQRAQWDLLLLDIEHRTEQIRATRRQSRWETPRAVAMVALALAAVFAAGRLADPSSALWVWSPHPQSIAIHFDQPVVVHLDQPPRLP